MATAFLGGELPLLIMECLREHGPSDAPKLLQHFRAALGEEITYFQLKSALGRLERAGLVLQDRRQGRSRGYRDLNLLTEEGSERLEDFAGRLRSIRAKTRWTPREE